MALPAGHSAPVGLHSAGDPQVRQQPRGPRGGRGVLQRAQPLQRVLQPNLPRRMEHMQRLLPKYTHG